MPPHRLAVIVAGSDGNSDSSLLPGQPWSLAPVIGQPVLAHLVEKLTKEGFNDILLLSPTEADYGIENLEVVVDPKEGWMKEARPDQDKPYLVIGAEVLLKADLSEAHQFHRMHRSPLTVCVRDAPGSPFGEVSLQGTSVGPRDGGAGRVCSLGGVYIINATEETPNFLDLNWARDWVEAGKVASGYRLEGFWEAVVDGPSLHRLNMLLVEERSPRSRNFQCSVDGPVIIDPTADIDQTVKIRGPTYIGRDVKVCGRVTLSNTFVGNGTYIGPGATIGGSMMLDQNKIGQWSTIEDSYLGSGCDVAPRVSIVGEEALPGSEFKATPSRIIT